MRSLIIILLFLSFVNASNLLTYNIYERSDRVDVMLSFDSPYEGRITQKRGENITILILSDLTYDKLIEKNINSNILQAITIEPNKDTMNIILKSANNIAVIASKTVDGFGLRIRTKPLKSPIKTNSVKTSQKSNTTNNQTNLLNTKSSEDLIDGRYISVILVLAVMLIFMFWLKKRILKKQNNVKEKNSWLFKDSGKKMPSREVNVLHKKQIDNTNSVVLLEFEDKKYLVMTGSSNLLLEKFSHGEVKDDSDFEKAFEDNRRKLDDYLKLEKDVSTTDYRSKLEKY